MSESDWWGIENPQLDLPNLLSTHAYGWKRQIIRIHNWKEWINKKYILTVTYSDLGWVNENLMKLQGEGRMVRQRLTPKSDSYAFARWLVNSKRGLGQFRQANTNISERDLKTVYPMVLTTSGKTPGTRRVIPCCPITKQCHVIPVAWYGKGEVEV